MVVFVDTHNRMADMAKVISMFNNKGGVGKTTYLFHVAHMLARHAINVLVVDCDSQCNLTAYAWPSPWIKRAWHEEGNSIWRNIELVARGIGDIRNRTPSPISLGHPRLFMVPGDLKLSDFEDRLGETWSGARGGNEAALRVQSAIHRYIRWAAEKVSAHIVLVDLGPNLGALNRAVLASSDYFIVPMAPDLFSVRGTENLASKLKSWHAEWRQCHESWKGDNLELPNGRPKFLGYVIQNHNRRNNETGMTHGWGLYGRVIANAVNENIINALTPLDQVVDWDDGEFNLGQIPNLHSLIPYSQRARKPVFYCTSRDGLKGAHITRAAESMQYFLGITEIIQSTLEMD